MKSSRICVLIARVVWNWTSALMLLQNFEWLSLLLALSFPRRNVGTPHVCNFHGERRETRAAGGMTNCSGFKQALHSFL